MAYREGIFRYDSKSGGWCFDEGSQIQALREGDQIAIRILESLLSGTVVYLQGDECRLSFRDYGTWAKIEIALCRGSHYSGVMELEFSSIVG